MVAKPQCQVCDTSPPWFPGTRIPSWSGDGVTGPVQMTKPNETAVSFYFVCYCPTPRVTVSNSHFFPDTE